MFKSIKIIGGCVAATLLLVSCNKDTRIAENADLGVNFRVTSGALTKATPTTVANLGAFKVTAIGNSASYFTDLNVAVTSAGVCTPEKTYYWPGYELGFYAYANPSGGTVSITNAAKGVAGVTPVAAAADQSDFVVAYSTGTKADNMASGVALNFRHALSQIKVKATNKSTAGLKINVKGVKVANVKAAGDFSYPAAVTSGNNAATLDFALWNTGSASKTAYSIGGTSETAVVLDGTAKDIMFSGSSWMLVPQQLVAWNLTSDKTNSNANAYIGVYLQILDASNGQLYPATAGQYAYANVPIDTKWEPGKTYTYTLNFLDEAAGGGAGVDDAGNPVLGSPINFSLTIDDWDSPNVQDINVGATDNNTAKDCTFGGLQISKGPLYYDGSEYKIADNWKMNSNGTAYGKEVNSTYFSFIEMGELFEKSPFTISDGNIDNLLNPFDGWRIPTTDEWNMLITDDPTVRPGSTVNGISNVLHLHGTISGTRMGYILLFPDGKTITGPTFSYYNDYQTNNDYRCTLSENEINDYISKGCICLPGIGFYSHEDPLWDTYWTNCDIDESSEYLSATSANDINYIESLPIQIVSAVACGDNGSKSKNCNYLPIRLVK